MPATIRAHLVRLPIAWWLTSAALAIGCSLSNVAIAQARTAAAPTAKTQAKTVRKTTPVKSRRRARPAAGQSSAQPVRVPDASDAATARAYRKDAARHIYDMNADSIYKGRMPPLLYAVGVLQVHVDGQGRVGTISWMRAPRHAPEVMRQIERIVRAADPFPPPKLIGGLIYTDTWLWHKSGQWQLDTLTEGQD